MTFPQPIFGVGGRPVSVTSVGGLDLTLSKGVSMTQRARPVRMRRTSPPRGEEQGYFGGVERGISGTRSST